MLIGNNGMTILKSILTPQRTIMALRWSLAVIYIWFGILKVLGYNPVYDIVNGTYPLLATEAGTIVLGLVEVLIGLGLATNVWPRVVSSILVIHMAGTFLTFLTTPALMFDPYFPILSFSGEFVVKNLVLTVAGLVILAHQWKK